jgi:hypothetical protein
MVGENGEGFLRVTDSVRAHPFHSIFIDLGFLGFLLSLPPLPSLTFSFLPLFPGQAAPKQDQQDRTRNNRTEPGQTGSIEPNQDQQDRTRTNRTEPGPTEPNQDKQDRTRTLGGLRGRFGKVWDASWSVLGRVLARLERASFWSVLGTSRVVSRRLESVLGAS